MAFSMVFVQVFELVLAKELDVIPLIPRFVVHSNLSFVSVLVTRMGSEEVA